MTERQKTARDFWTAWERFEDWLVSAQKSADTTRELYADKMPANIAKIKVSIRNRLYFLSKE